MSKIYFNAFNLPFRKFQESIESKCVVPVPCVIEMRQKCCITFKRPGRLCVVNGNVKLEKNPDLFSRLRTTSERQDRTSMNQNIR